MKLPFLVRHFGMSFNLCIRHSFNFVPAKRPNSSGSITGRSQNFILFRALKLTLQHNKFIIQCILVTISPEINRPVREDG